MCSRPDSRPPLQCRGEHRQAPGGGDPSSDRAERAAQLDLNPPRRTSRCATCPTICRKPPGCRNCATRKSRRWPASRRSMISSSPIGCPQAASPSAIASWTTEEDLQSRSLRSRQRPGDRRRRRRWTNRRLFRQPGRRQRALKKRRRRQVREHHRNGRRRRPGQGQRVGRSADIDNDGDVDLYVTTVRGGNVLFENDGKGRFRDITAAAGLGYVGHSSSAVFFDYNRDGRVDLLLVNVGRYTMETTRPRAIASITSRSRTPSPATRASARRAQHSVPQRRRQPLRRSSRRSRV